MGENYLFDLIPTVSADYDYDNDNDNDDYMLSPLIK